LLNECGFIRGDTNYVFKSSEIGKGRRGSQLPVTELEIKLLASLIKRLVYERECGPLHCPVGK
jgi:hypothetical protein